MSRLGGPCTPLVTTSSDPQRVARPRRADRPPRIRLHAVGPRRAHPARLLPLRLPRGEDDAAPAGAVRLLHAHVVDVRRRPVGAEPLELQVRRRAKSRVRRSSTSKNPGCPRIDHFPDPPDAGSCFAAVLPRNVQVSWCVRRTRVAASDSAARFSEPRQIMTEIMERQKWKLSSTGQSRKCRPSSCAASPEIRDRRVGRC
jgi:hypothetical protein